LRGGFDYTALEPVNVAGPGSSASTGAINSASGVNSFAGPITMTAASTVNVGADTLTLNSNIGGAFALTKSGSGSLVLAGTNGYTGSTTVRGGTLRFDSDARLGPAPGSPTLNFITVDNGTISTSTSFTLNANRGMTVGGVATTPNNATIAPDTGTTLTYNGNIAGATAGNSTLVKSGGGMLVLGGTNTHKTGTDVAAGTLRVSSDGALGDAYTTGEISLLLATSGAGYTSPPTVTLSGGGGSGATTVINMKVANVVVTAGGSSYVDGNAATFVGGGGVTQATGTISVTSGAITAVNLATGGAGYATQPSVSFITGTGGAATPFLGINTLTLTTTGAGYVSPPTVSFTAPTGTGAVTPTAVAYVKGLVTLSGGTLQTGASFSTNRPVFLNSVGGTVDTDGNDNTFSGALTGPGSLTKAGAGRLTLTNSNTYTGTTNIAGGTLSLVSSTSNNNIASSPIINVQTQFDVSGISTAGGFIVASGQTLKGTGTVVGAMTVGPSGNLAPGNSVGTIATDNLTFADGTTNYFIELDADTPASDRTNVTGTVSLGGAGLRLSFVAITPDTHGNPQTFVIINNDSNEIVSGTFGAITAPSFLQVVVNYAYSGFDSTNFNADGNDVAITITYVPEPASGMVMMVMAAAMLRRRRRAA